MKIDFVIPWVDGNDSAWEEKIQEYTPQEGDNVHPARYRDWGLLKYLFRGIEEFAPWVNKIWVITDRQVPKWMNADHHKIEIISQDSILPPKCNPSFNINAIELNIHRIPGLSEHFVYLNDDMFFLRPTPETCFFRKGLPCDAAILSPVIVTRKMDVGSIVINNMCIINTHFDKKKVIRTHPFQWLNVHYGIQGLRTLCLLPWRHFAGFFNPHLPQAYLKSTFEKVWEAEPERLYQVSSHSFRNYYADLNQWLMRYWQICSGTFIPISARHGKDLSVMQIDKTADIIYNRRYQYICINDDEIIDNIEPYSHVIENALKSVLRQKSSFER